MMYDLHFESVTENMKKKVIQNMHIGSLCMISLCMDMDMINFFSRLNTGNILQCFRKVRQQSCVYVDHEQIGG